MPYYNSTYPHPAHTEFLRLCYRTGILAITALLAAGCSTFEGTAYEQAAARHGLKFATPQDSSATVWARAQQWITMEAPHTLAPVMVVTEALIQTTPAITGGSKSFSVFRIPQGDSARFEVSYQYKQTSQYDFLGGAFALRDAQRLAFFAHTGIDAAAFNATQADTLGMAIDTTATPYISPEASIVPTTGAGGPIANAQGVAAGGTQTSASGNPSQIAGTSSTHIDASKEKTPVAAWIGAGGGPNGWNLDFGLRYWHLAAEAGIVSNGMETKPSDILDYSPPHSNWTTKSYRNGTFGIDLYAVIDPFANLTLFAGPGYYIQDYTILKQSRATGWYYDDGDRKSAGSWLTAAGGLYWNFAGVRGTGMLLGATYHTLRGVSVMVGGTL